MNWVLDACSLIAYLRGEPGADLMRRILRDSESTCFAHALNISEVYRDFLVTDGRVAAAEAYATILLAGVTIREDLDPALWMDAAARRTAHRMSLADSHWDRPRCATERRLRLQRPSRTRLGRVVGII